MTDAPEQLAEALAAAVATALPSQAPLTTAPAQEGTVHVTAAFAGAVAADLDGGVPGPLVICVGTELVEALAESPFGTLDLAAAVQPALDLAAAQLGAQARQARTLDLSAEGFDIAAVLGGPFLAVPLIGTGIAAAVLLSHASAQGARTPVAVAVGASAEPGAAADAGTADRPAEPFVPAFGTPPPPRMARGLEMLHGVDMEVTVELGRTRMTVRDLLALTPGAVLELDRAAGSPADLLVNGRLVARGEVVVVDEDFGLRVTEIVDAAAAG
ncbi:flagellar motor switch protein FliN [Nocardioides sp. GY 10113]|uniref:flagellar motor switch protein FliN n=1 Tax=Nocardioides sp. GY 10113 TaxID=2569761 RepID=UPI0010A762D3|nr:flagellar motor switch protein FliN [Nocardioides sp. GY 10113]TIC83533.1 flagellar motor switch protein FliN [Nocardioides sp. GY 10113]